MTSERRSVLTIGHSNHLVNTFLTLLQQHGVTALADVRSSPYSRFVPQFNQEALKRSLKAYDIKYVFLGRELGARPDDRSCYAHGRVQYARLAQTDAFRSGIERVVRGANDYRVALMCAEKEPLECHRTLLVARALDDLGVPVEHILPNGRRESHSEAMLRLLKVVRFPSEDLFRSQQELIALALAQQEERIAYVDENLAAETAGDTL
jgi:uncharacterized protein (DUF488 family)